ncbi:MAG: FtsX-like permease family protein [Cyclobacteriaceae bacterium]
MNLPIFIARRYFFSKKKKNFINVISMISMVGVAIGTATLVVVLSVFNGLEDLIRGLYNTFDPEIKVMPLKGKTFELQAGVIQELEALPAISIITEVIEDNALARFKESEHLVRVKGVSDNFIDQNRLNNSIVVGELIFRKDNINYAIIGRGVQYALSLSMKDDFNSLQLFSPRNINPGNLNPSRLFNQRNILPGGIFAVEKFYDENYVFVPLDFAKSLFNTGDRRSSLEIQLVPEADIVDAQRAISRILGSDYSVQNSDEQHSDLFKLLSIEKLFVFLTFSFILAIASFNIFFSLSMLAIDKRTDIAVLNAMGADQTVIKKIFISEGIIIAVIGSVIGLGLGLIICWLQQAFGLVSMGMATSILDAYPVRVQWTDFLYTGLLIFLITFLASYRPAVIAAKSLNISHLQ